MTKKNVLISFSCFLFIILTFNARGQPFIVDEAYISPTTFRTWEPITVIYRVRYLEGDRFKISLSRAQPKEMNFGEFEAEKLDVVFEQEMGKEYHALFIYTLRHKSRKKETKEIPSQTFFYYREQPGKEESEVEMEKFRTSKIFLNYVTTITEDASDIRDEMDFGRYDFWGYLWLAISLVGLLSSFFLAYLVAFGGRKSLKKKNLEAAEKKNLTGEQKSGKFNFFARLRFARKLNELKDATLYDKKFDRELYQAIREFLVAKIKNAGYSDSSRQLLERVFALMTDRRYLEVCLLPLAQWVRDKEELVYSDVRYVFEDKKSAEKGIDYLLELASKFKLRKYILKAVVFYLMFYFKVAMTWFKMSCWTVKELIKRLKKRLNRWVSKLWKR